MKFFGQKGMARALAVLAVIGSALIDDFALAGEAQNIGATKKLALHGDAKAQNDLGEMYVKGEGVDQDFQQAAIWFRKAVKGNNAEAMFNLATIYEKGQGVHQDYNQATDWYRKADEQGHKAADSRIDLIDEVLAALDCAAEEGRPEEQAALAELYANGNGVPQSEVQAAEWYRKSADQGNAKAQQKLGLVYAEGKGVPQDDAQAVAWYRKAIDQDYAPAKYALAGMYFKGKGVAKDKVQAYAWLSLAAAQGDGNAIANKEFIVSMLTPEQVSEAEALAAQLQSKIDELAKQKP